MNRDTSGPISACGFPDKHSTVCLHTGPSCVAIVDAVVEGYISLGTAVKQILITAKTAFGEGLNRFTTPVSNCLIDNSANISNILSHRYFFNIVARLTNWML